VIEKRVQDASFCVGGRCKVFFQDQEVPVPVIENTVSMKSDRWVVHVAPSRDGFRQVSYVNGVCTTKGGTHVDHVVSLITSGIIEELGNKINLRPAQVKETLSVVIKATLVNPTFTSQVKSECSLPVKEFGSRCEFPGTFIKNILKSGVRDLVTSLSKFKELSELKKSDGAPKKSKIVVTNLDDANWAGTVKSDRCTLVVCEGISAMSMAIAGLSVVGRDTYGVFPLRGKFKNVRDASVKALMANEEFSNLKKILGLQQDKVYSTLKELRYGRLMIMTDAGEPNGPKDH